MHPDATVAHRVTESPASHKKVVTKVRYKVMHIRGYTIGVVIDMPLQIEIHLLLSPCPNHISYLIPLCIISFVGSS